MIFLAVSVSSSSSFSSFDGDGIVFLLSIFISFPSVAFDANVVTLRITIVSNIIDIGRILIRFLLDGSTKTIETMKILIRLLESKLLHTHTY